jgi:acetyl/propionyl-CoA carboxylase alpha subunit
MKIGICNRGEVALRIIRAIKELGHQSVLIHSTSDKGTRAYREADETAEIIGHLSIETYLDIPKNIHAALSKGCKYIHPGFGFLSENPDFAEACLSAGIKFIGPSPSAIKLLGNKIECKNLATQLGIPLVPGYQGADQTIKKLSAECTQIGYPVLVKAAAGGGGRGMKVIRDPGQVVEMITSAQREAQTAFGNPQVFLERYLEKAKHIEIQVFVSHAGKAHSLFERECSVQRRHQKIIEEAPSMLLPESIRSQMRTDAEKLAIAGKYKGAGTVEFLWQGNEYFLLEVNTRLQVEHTVTEMIAGVDLVKAQILTAMDQEVFEGRIFDRPQGHSIECRIYAENNGLPSIGKIGLQHFKEGPFRRFEFAFEAGDTVTDLYDPMIAKVIVWDETRTRAIQKMIQTLKETTIFGVYTNIPQLIGILEHALFIDGTMTTRFYETQFEPNFKIQENVFESDFVNELRQLATNKNDLSFSAPSENLRSPFSGPWRAD